MSAPTPFKCENIFDPLVTIGVALLIFFGSIFIASLLLALIGTTPPTLDPSDPIGSLANDPAAAHYFISHMMLQTTLGAAVIYGLVRAKASSGVEEALGLHRLPMPVILPWAAGAAGLSLLVNLIGPALRDGLGVEAAPDPFGAAEMTILFIIAAVIAAPLFEELMFRGFLFQSLATTRIGVMGAAFVTTLIWMLLHSQLDPIIALFIFGFGLFLCYARVKTESLLIPIAMHGAFNGTSLLIAAV